MIQVHGFVTRYSVEGKAATRITRFNALTVQRVND
jgi:hypothetical protein